MGSFLDALPSALDALEQDRATLYSDVVLAALPQAAKRYLEDVMAPTPAYLREYQSDFVRRYVVQGRAEGEAKALLMVLDARGVGISEDARAHIENCHDTTTLDVWIRRAVTATTAEEIFGEPEL